MCISGSQDTVAVQALTQRQLSPHSVPLQMSQQQMLAQLQPGQEKLSRRRQSPTIGGSKKGDRSATDTKAGGETGLEVPSVATGLPQLLNQPLSQMQMSWHPQAPNFVGIPQVHQPPVLQHFKQQLSSLSIPSLQHQ